MLLEPEALEGGLEGLVVAPPDAEPDPGFAGSVALGELGVAPDDELDELGEVAELPPEGDVVDEGELEPVLDGGVELAPLLVLPLVVPLVVSLSWPQAARPKAMATAIARVESFMCPPWLDEGESSKLRARGKPLKSRGPSLGPALRDAATWCCRGCAWPDPAGRWRRRCRRGCGSCRWSPTSPWSR